MPSPRPGTGLGPIHVAPPSRPGPVARAIVRACALALLLIAGAAGLATPAQAAWSSQTSSLNAVILGTTSCPSSTDCVQQNTAGRFQYTTNGGTSWTASGADLAGSTWGLDCPSTNICYSTSDNGSVYKSTDHGATWTTSFTGSPALYGIACPTDTLCYATTADGRFRKTTDGGSSWTIGATQSTVGIYSVSCPSTTVCYAVTATGEVRKKQAASDTWDLMATGASMPDVLSPYTHGITCPSLTVCYVGATDGTINKTSDSGSTWVAQTTATAPDVYAIDCWSVTRCAAVGVANRSLFTDDGGTTWTQENTGSAAAMYSVDFASATKAIAGDAIGVPYAYGAPALPAGDLIADATVTAGTLNFANSTPGNVVFPAVTLNGYDQTRTQAQAITINDATGSGGGWAISATSTHFMSGGNRLTPSAVMIPSPPAAICDALSTCTAATNTVPYPFTMPAGVTAPPAEKMFNAALGSGLGVQTITPTWQLAIPSRTRAGTYTSTWTFTLATGP